MRKINYVIGDATEPLTRPAVIAHICNDVGAWGAGFVVALSNKWPEPENLYRHWSREVGEGSTFKLGEIQFAAVRFDLVVANMLAQEGFPSRQNRVAVRYDALESCLKKLFAWAAENKWSVHMPRIGCGIAGGEWKTVAEIIERLMGDVPVAVYTRPQEEHYFDEPRQNIASTLE